MFGALFKPTGALALALSLAGCGGYTPMRYPAVGAPDMLTRVVANPNFRAIDGNSFADAVMLYPTRILSSHHSVPVGDYLLSRTVLALPSDAAIVSLRLVDYRSVCGPSRAFAPQARCKTKASFAIVTREGQLVVDVEAEPDVGPMIVAGDISPPFNWGDAFIEVIHEQARNAVDGLQIKMRDAFSGLPRRISRYRLHLAALQLG